MKEPYTCYALYQGMSQAAALNGNIYDITSWRSTTFQPLFKHISTTSNISIISVKGLNVIYKNSKIFTNTYRSKLSLCQVNSTREALQFGYDMGALRCSQ